MSENLNRGACDFSQYDTMTNEALEELLRLDSEASEGQESDTERLLYIMELLAQRDRQLRRTGNTAQEAWKAFQQDYLPIADDPKEDPEPKPTAKPVRLRLYRWIAVAAAMAMLIAIPVVASAYGWQEFWNAVAKWTKDTFSFVGSENTSHTSPSPEKTNHYSSLQEAIAAAGLQNDALPVWIPERFELENILVHETPVQKSFRVFYYCGENNLSICIHTYVSAAPEHVEIDETLMEIYEVSGRKFYIFCNFDHVRAAWIEGNHECYISGDLTLEELKQIVDSIPAK